MTLVLSDSLLLILLYFDVTPDTAFVLPWTRGHVLRFLFYFITHIYTFICFKRCILVNPACFYVRFTELTNFLDLKGLS